MIDQAYILIWILKMFETPLEGPTVVATHYGPSHCLVMFASETPVANKYPNRLLLYHMFLCKASLPSISQGGALDRIVFQSGLVMSDRP